MDAALRQIILSKRELVRDDFGSYADSAALLAVWTAGGGAAVSLNGGTMEVVRAATSNEKGYRTISTFVVGRIYRLTWSGSGTQPTARFATTSNFAASSITDVNGAAFDTSGRMVFVAPATTLLLGFGGGSNGTSAYDNVLLWG